MSHYAAAVLKQLDRVFNHGTALGLSEGKLLERYVAARDEVAFAALVARHGPMVLGVCRRILRDDHDVEDAFQATFLVLVRRAAAIRRRELIGQWLHGVAHRVAVRARAQSARRHVHETTGLPAAETSAGIMPVRDPQPELRAILDDELARLPASLRSPVVLCYLEGLTHDEAAQRLRWPVGTVRSRMARARALLRRRLARRGVMTDGAAVGAALARQPIAIELIDSTVNASLAFIGPQTAAAGVASTTAAALAEGVLQTMMISKLKIAGAAALATVLAVGGVRTLARQQTGRDGPAAPVREAAKESRSDSTDQSARRESLLRSVDRIDEALDDQVRRSHDLQNEVRALRKEIAALRSEEPESPKKAAPATERRIADPSGPFIQGVGTGRKAADRPANAEVIAAEALPGHYDEGQFIIITSPHGDRAAIYSRQTLKTNAVRLFDPKGPRHVLAVQSNGWLAALNAKGPNISRIAVYAGPQQGPEGWYTQDLRQRVEEATAIIEGPLVVYDLGCYVYGFDAIRRHWAVLELPPGSRKTLTHGGQKFTVDTRSHLYEFYQNASEWHDIDFTAILDNAPIEESADLKKPVTP